MIVVAVVSAAIAVVAFGWTGFRVRPRPLRLRLETEPAAPTAPATLPQDLPDPVARFYGAIGAGDQIARVDTFALWGRAWMRRRPLPWLPVSFWSAHDVGRSGVQLLAVTWFGLPVLRGRDQFADGRGEMRIGGHRVTGPEIDQGENLFLWAELVLVPSVLSTQPEARWEPVGPHAARLRVPFGDGEDELVFFFDPATGLISHCRALRYRDVGGPKIGWRLDYKRWRSFGDGTYPGRIVVTWEDQGRPWFILDVDGVATNIPASAITTSPGSSAPHWSDHLGVMF